MFYDIYLDIRENDIALSHERVVFSIALLISKITGKFGVHSGLSPSPQYHWFFGPGF
jgi:hypothetical protein